MRLLLYFIITCPKDKSTSFTRPHNHSTGFFSPKCMFISGHAHTHEHTVAANSHLMYTFVHLFPQWIRMFHFFLLNSTYNNLCYNTTRGNYLWVQSQQTYHHGLKRPKTQTSDYMDTLFVKGAACRRVDIIC